MVVVEGQRCEIAWQEIVKFESSILIVILEVISISFYEQAGARGAKERGPFGAAWLDLNQQMTTGSQQLNEHIFLFFQKQKTKSWKSVAGDQGWTRYDTL